jgi:hypothetical protein
MAPGSVTVRDYWADDLHFTCPPPASAVRREVLTRNLSGHAQKAARWLAGAIPP